MPVVPANAPHHATPCARVPASAGVNLNWRRDLAPARPHDDRTDDRTNDRWGPGPRAARPRADPKTEASERVPGRVRGELEIPDVGAQPQPDTRSHRPHHDIVRGHRRHAEPADEIARTVD